MKWYENNRMLEPRPKDMDMSLYRIIPFADAYRRKEHSYSHIILGGLL